MGDDTRPEDAALLRDDWTQVAERLSREERALVLAVREWCEVQVLPVIGDHWEAGDFPLELFRGIGTLGIVGGDLGIDSGPRLSKLAYGMVTAELARCDGSLATFFGVQSSLAMRSIALLGSDEQQQRWLPALADVSKLGCFALTEPAHGSDVVALETTAEPDGDEWVLRGRKRWIGNGTVADIAVVWARDTDGEVGGFVIDRDRAVTDNLGDVAGWFATAIEGKTANRCVWQADIEIEGVRIPAEDRLAGARSFADTDQVLTASRAGVAWEALGHAEAAYDLAVAYATDREQFGEPIGGFQMIQQRLAGMLAALISLRHFLVGTCGVELTPELASLMKMQAARTARQLLADSRATLGGNGILQSHHVARHHADIEATYTYEGTDDVQSLVVGRGITGLSAFS